MLLDLWLRECSVSMQDFQHVSKCPKRQFMLPLHQQQVPAHSSFLHAVPVLPKCHHCAQKGICWVHSCKSSSRGTNRLLKTKLRTRNLSACHLYYLFCFICLLIAHEQGMEILPGSRASQRTQHLEYYPVLLCAAGSVFQSSSPALPVMRIALCTPRCQWWEEHMLGTTVNPRVRWNQQEK